MIRDWYVKKVQVTYEESIQSKREGNWLARFKKLQVWFNIHNIMFPSLFALLLFADCHF